MITIEIRTLPGFWQRLNLECGDTSPLSDWETCLPVLKRGHVRALQMKALPGFFGWFSIPLSSSK
jgi:hypothetical protein